MIFDYDTAPIVGMGGTSEGRHFLCFACAEPGDDPIHADPDQSFDPPACYQCGKPLAVPHAELDQAFADWNSGRAYVNISEEYWLDEDQLPHLSQRREAPWNRTVRRAYPDHNVFIAAARLNAKGGTPR